MTNAELFKTVFGTDADVIHFYTLEQFVKWLGEEYDPDRDVPTMCVVPIDILPVDDCVGFIKSICWNPREE